MKSTAIARNCKSVNCAEIVNNNKRMKEGITFCGTSVTVTVTMHIALVRPAVGACRCRVHIHLLNGSGTPIKPCTHTIFIRYRYNQLNGKQESLLLARTRALELRSALASLSGRRQVRVELYTVGVRVGKITLRFACSI